MEHTTTERHSVGARGTALSRDEFVAGYLESARGYARSFARRLPPGWVEVDDLVSAATVGLLESYPRYSSGRPFNAHLVIKRAVVGSIRSNAILHPSLRSGLPTEKLPESKTTHSHTEFTDEIRRALDTAAALVLTPRERMLLELVFERGLTLRTIGKRHLLDRAGKPTPPLPDAPGDHCLKINGRISGERTVRREYWRAIVKLRRAMRQLR